MPAPLPIYAGYDRRESAGYHAFCQSIIDNTSVPVAITPLHGPMLKGFDGQRDGTNAFIYSRFLVPYLQHYQGWAIFADGSDMIALGDLAELMEHCETRWVKKAVVVVKHDYKTKQPRKYIGTPMEADNGDYPCKNWSSLILWNCGHWANRRLTPELVRESPGSFLHRFQWLAEDEIGELSPDWNVLVGEQDVGKAKLLHYTAGIAGFKHYANCDGAEHWHKARANANYLIGELSSP